MKEKAKQKIVEMLAEAYWMEMETVLNYTANAIDLDGIRAEEVKKALLADVTAELMHAQAFARRIKELGGRIPGSKGFKASQKTLQPPDDSTEVVAVIRGVLDAEEAAIVHYNKLIEAAGHAHDYVTQDLGIRTLADEEGHRVQFEGYLKEYKKG